MSKMFGTPSSGEKVPGPSVKKDSPWIDALTAEQRDAFAKCGIDLSVYRQLSGFAFRRDIDDALHAANGSLTADEREFLQQFVDITNVNL